MIAHRIPRPVLALALGALAGLAAVAPAFAGSVTQEVTAGTRSVTVTNLTLTSKAYSHSDQTSTGSLTLTADDSTGSGDGWNVTIQSSAFAYTGSEAGTAIAADKFSITTANTPVMTAGEAIDATGGPKVSLGATGALNTARETMEANVGFGEGTYTQGLDVSLTIPGGSRAGTYTGTTTVTIAAGPGA